MVEVDFKINITAQGSSMTWFTDGAGTTLETKTTFHLDQGSVSTFFVEVTKLVHFHKPCHCLIQEVCTKPV